jgi:LmbE family N-acetylglucosaminyl deacetylase
LTAADRLFVLAPHPDDESLAAGGLLLHAVAAGAAIRVVFFTDGENNPWAQRACELRLRVGPEHRHRFGARRRNETRNALHVLGTPGDCVTRLSYPDQGATRLLLADPEPVIARLAAELRGSVPSVFVTPSIYDLHPDHSAVAIFAHFVLRRWPSGVAPPRHLRYAVHNPELRASRGWPILVTLDEAQRERKRDAIRCHSSQFFFRGPWLLSFAAAQETFASDDARPAPSHPIRGVHRSRESFALTVELGRRLRSFGAATLHLVAEADGVLQRLAVELPRRTAEVPVADAASGTVLAHTQVEGRRGRLVVHLPPTLLPTATEVFAKVERRFGFFDEAGWLPIRPVAG